jgi:hypothetical protein
MFMLGDVDASGQSVFVKYADLSAQQSVPPKAAKRVSLSCFERPAPLNRDVYPTQEIRTGS